MRAVPLFSVLALGLLIACSTTAAAESTATGQLTLRALRSEGSMKLDGGFLALYRLDQLQSEVPLDASFQLVAGEVRVVTYESDPAVTAGDTWLAPVAPGYQPNETTYLGVRVTSREQTHPQFQFGIVAAPGTTPALHLPSGCADLSSSDRGEMEVPWLIQAPAEPVKADVSRAVRYSECASSNVEVEGDFTLVLFGVDAVLETDSQVVELRSGFDQSSVLPDPAAGAAQDVATHMRQQYLYVTQGRIRFALDEAPHFLYVQDPAVELDGTLLLTDARGQLAQGGAVVPVRAHRLAVDGQLHGVLANPGQQQPLQLALTGHIVSADADGQALALSSTAATPSPPWLWLVAVPLVALLAWLVPRQVPRARARRLVHVARSLTPSEADRVVELCSRAVALDGSSAHAYLFRARALASIRDLPGAQADCELAWRLLPASDPDRALAAWQGFLVAQHQGLPDREEWLMRARESQGR